MHYIYIILLLILLFFIIYELIYKINFIENFIVNTNKPVNSYIDNEINKMTISNNLISNIQSCIDTSYPLSQYAIKSSYNSCNSGTCVSTNAIQYVIKRGCRFLDFEVYIDENNNSPFAIVSYSNATINNITNTNTVKLDSINTLMLDDVFSTCISNAFSASNAPNFKDPLFIQLRLKTGKSSLQPIINSIKYTLIPKLYIDSINNIAIPVNSNTLLKDIMGKIILVVDSNLLDITLIKQYINISSNTQNWKKYYYRNIDNMTTNPPTINLNKNNNITSVNNLSMILPSSFNDTNIPTPFSVFSEYGIQTLLVPFYSINNQNLILYEQLFNTAKGGVVPFSVIISYSNDFLSNKN